MTEFVEENIREIEFDLENIPDSLIYRLEEVEFTFSPLAFGIGEHLQIEYYERKFERACPGLLNQFPCLYYLVEEMHAAATQKTPLEEIMEKSYNFINDDNKPICLKEEEILADGRQLRQKKNQSAPTN